MFGFKGFDWSDKEGSRKKPYLSQDVEMITVNERVPDELAKVSQEEIEKLLTTAMAIYGHRLADNWYKKASIDKNKSISSFSVADAPYDLGIRLSFEYSIERQEVKKRQAKICMIKRTSSGEVLPPELIAERVGGEWKSYVVTQYDDK